MIGAFKRAMIGASTRTVFGAFERVGVALAIVAALTASIPLAAQQPPSGGDGTFLIGTYGQEIIVLDERTFQVAHRIPTRSRIPGDFTLSENRERLYSVDASMEWIEVFDIAGRESVDYFTLTRGNTKFRIAGMEVHPDESYAILVGEFATRERDRWTVGGNVMIRVDLTTKQVMDTIPWPGDHERERVGMQFSPDGSLLYFYAEDVIVLETDGFTEVDRWELSQPFEPGLGRIGVGFPRSLYEEPGFHTGLFRVTDPVQNRRMMGVARVNLTEKSVDFYTLGPSEPLQGLAIAPDRSRAYSLYSEVGRYEFWTFDLEGRRVVNRQEFAGRPRMGLDVSTNGDLLYIHVAGRTIDIYDADTYEYLHTVELDGDMTGFLLLPASE